MSIQYTQQEITPSTIPFSKTFAKIMYANSRHVSSHDWSLLPNTPLLSIISDDVDTYFLLVPEDSYHLHQSLIDFGFSFAFVSLLQVAVRNSAAWIHFCPTNPLISGIHVFSKEDIVQ